MNSFELKKTLILTVVFGFLALVSFSTDSSSRSIIQEEENIELEVLGQHVKSILKKTENLNSYKMVKPKLN